MNTLRPHTTGLALGGFFAVFHFLWAVLVASGWAQSAMDLVFRLHMLEPVLRIAPFSIALAVGLIVLTFVVGYVLGWIFATVWNMAQR
jgi:hypothetical protein